MKIIHKKSVKVLLEDKNHKFIFYWLIQGSEKHS